MTAIHPVNATVERVARKEPPEPEVYVGLYWDGYAWHLFEDEDCFQTREAALRSAEQVEPHAPVRLYSPSPLPSPASAEIDQLLVELRNRIEELAFHGGDDRRTYALDALSALSERLGRVTR